MLHPLYAKERYALISGVDLMTQTIDPSKHRLLFEEKEHNDTKEELFNSMSFLRPKSQDEVNITQEAMV